MIRAPQSENQMGDMMRGMSEMMGGMLVAYLLGVIVLALLIVFLVKAVRKK